MKKKLIDFVNVACPMLQLKKKTKKSKIKKMNECINKKQYIDILINNDDFQNVELLTPHTQCMETDDQIFSYALLPHMFTFHSIIVHISTSADGHVHDMEMYKLILLLGKLQKFNFSWKKFIFFFLNNKI